AAATTATTATAASWQQARFSVTLPPQRGPEDRLRVVTAAVTNGLAPLLEGVDEGIGLLHLLNSTALLSIAPITPTPLPSTHSDAAAATGAAAVAAAAAAAPATSSVALTLHDGSAAWGAGQELVLSMAGEGAGGEGGEGEQQQQGQQKRGSARYDFLVVWSALSKITAVEGDLFAVASSDEAASGTTGAAREGIVNAKGFQRGREGKGESEGGGGGEGEGEGRGSGPAGGHVVGELRPLSEFSGARQEALEEALVTIGVDPKELTEADEFYGSAALKAYNTFVRPRPKQLSKVVQESIPRAALRTAHQVAFLVRRHRADRAEYLRNKDASMTEAERRGLTPHPVVLVCDNVRYVY
ncbi:unnamed protein product, partial [Laminaria digitata]